MSVFAADLPLDAAGRWCRVSVRMPGEACWWAKLEATDEARGQVVREVFFGPRARRGAARRSLLVHIPGAARALSLIVFSAGPARPALFLTPLSRWRAACLLLLQGFPKLPGALRGDRRGMAGRVRAVLGQAPARAGQAPPYSVWIDLFDAWGEPERAALAALPATCTSFEVALVAGGSAADVTASRTTLPAGWPVRIIETAADWQLLRADWVVVLAVGEVMAPHAHACFAQAVTRNPGARGLCADYDLIDGAGRRMRPCLLPPPDTWLLRAGVFPRGAAVFHRLAHAAHWPSLPIDADRARLALACAGPPETLHRLPLILTHCPDRVVTADWMQRPSSTRPAAAPMVSVIIPSACRSRHVLQCLRRLLQKTAYPAFEILLVVACVDPADRAQAATLRAARCLPHVRVIELSLPVFNFSAVNNAAAGFADGELLLLLNDDVIPVSGDWLWRMVAHVCPGDGPCADIVGARLLYGNGMVQHGGVIMGLANLCEHAFRLAGRGEPGPLGLALLDRRVSAVTAACMLVRRRLFASLGGLDEAFGIALNDVDFCLRAGAAGACIVLAAGVELYHFESLSLGRHYQGTRSALEALEVRRLRGRWAGVIAADPFYHPLASLQPGQEFQPGFPPRQTPLSWIRQDTPALH
jgi:GT2 family glycosyltransferase